MQKINTDTCNQKVLFSRSHAIIVLLFLNLILLSVGATNMTTKIEKDSKPRSVRQSLMAIDPEVQQELDNIYIRLNALSDGISDLRADLNAVMKEQGQQRTEIDRLFKYIGQLYSEIRNQNFFI